MVVLHFIIVLLLLGRSLPFPYFITYKILDVSRNLLLSSTFYVPGVLCTFSLLFVITTLPMVLHFHFRFGEGASETQNKVTGSRLSTH